MKGTQGSTQEVKEEYFVEIDGDKIVIDLDGDDGDDYFEPVS